MRVWRDPAHPGNIEVFDDNDVLVSRGHEELVTLPDEGGQTGVRWVPVFYVADWVRGPQDRPPGPERPWREPSGPSDDDLSTPARPA